MWVTSDAATPARSRASVAAAAKSAGASRRYSALRVPVEGRVQLARGGLDEDPVLVVGLIAELGDHGVPCVDRRLVERGVDRAARRGDRCPGWPAKKSRTWGWLRRVAGTAVPTDRILAAMVQPNRARRGPGPGSRRGCVPAGEVLRPVRPGVRASSRTGRPRRTATRRARAPRRPTCVGTTPIQVPSTPASRAAIGMHPPHDEADRGVHATEQARRGDALAERHLRDVVEQHREAQHEALRDEQGPARTRGTVAASGRNSAMTLNPMALTGMARASPIRFTMCGVAMAPTKPADRSDADDDAHRGGREAEFPQQEDRQQRRRERVREVRQPGAADDPPEQGIPEHPAQTLADLLQDRVALVLGRHHFGVTREDQRDERRHVGEHRGEDRDRGGQDADEPAADRRARDVRQLVGRLQLAVGLGDLLRASRATG